MCNWGGIHFFISHYIPNMRILWERKKREGVFDLRIFSSCLGSWYFLGAITSNTGCPENIASFEGYWNLSANKINNSLVTEYDLKCTLLQYLLIQKDSLSSLLDISEKTTKTYSKKGIGQYFPNTLYFNDVWMVINRRLRETR